MKRHLTIIGIGLTALLVTSLSADERGLQYFVSLKSLYDRCKDPNEAAQSFCAGYVAGVFDALSASPPSVVQKYAVGLAKCADKGISLTQARQALRADLSDKASYGGINKNPASHTVYAVLMVNLCDPPEERLDRINKELGPMPPVGTPEREEYLGLMLCMDLMKKSQVECRSWIREVLE